MNIYFYLVGIFSTLLLVHCQLPSLPEEAMKLMKECSKEIELPDEPPKGPLNFEDPNIKCMTACILKKRGSLVAGKINVEKAIEWSAKYFPGGSSDAAKAILTECAGKANEATGECEVAGTYRKCLMEKIPKA